MKRKRVEKIQKWLMELGPRGVALGELIAAMNETGESPDPAVVERTFGHFADLAGTERAATVESVEDARDGLAELSGLDVLDYLGQKLGPDAAAMAGMLRRMYLAPSQGNVYEPKSVLGSLALRAALDEEFAAAIDDPLSAAGLTDEEKKLLEDQNLAVLVQFFLFYLGWNCLGHSIHRPQPPGGGG